MVVLACCCSGMMVREGGVVVTLFTKPKERGWGLVAVGGAAVGVVIAVAVVVKGVGWGRERRGVGG